MPTATAGDNGALQPENAYDDIEGSSHATLDNANTPLSLDMLTDLTGYADSKGSVVKARLVIEFEATDDETVDLIEWYVYAALI